jgi:hypothetical protein
LVLTFVLSGNTIPHDYAFDDAVCLMQANCSPKVQVKAAGGVRHLDGLIRVRDLGASRCGDSATAAIRDEYRHREKRIGSREGSSSHGLTKNRFQNRIFESVTNLLVL